MPGMDTRAPDLTETSSGFYGITKFTIDRVFDQLEGCVKLGIQIIWIVPIVFIELCAEFRRDREAWRNGQADVRHLGKVGSFAAKEVAHVRAAFVVAGAKAVNPFGHYSCSLGSRQRVCLSIEGVFGVRRCAGRTHPRAI